VDVKLVNEKGQEVDVNEKGELLYRGHNVMKGYYNKPLETAEALRNGWLHSGDIAVKDEDGFYFIVDRTKDMIIRGGFNVYP
jgi:long-chain acyl-CoA synthetase